MDRRLAIVIAGRREDWPGGARTLTPHPPSREPNGRTCWFGAELDPDGDRAHEPGRVDDRRDARRELEDEPDGGALLGRGDRRTRGRGAVPLSSRECRLWGMLGGRSCGLTWRMLGIAGLVIAALRLLG